MFDDCPDYCARFSEKERKGSKDYCKGCDIKIAKDNLKEFSEKELDEKLGDRWKRYTFESLLSSVYSVYDIKDFKPHDLTPKAEILVGTFLSEESRQRRIERYNDKVKQN